MKAVTTSLLEHADVIIPAIQYLLNTLITVIVLIGGALCGTIGWVGRQFSRKFNAMDSKLDLLHTVMLSCDGCAASAKEYNSRKAAMGGLD